MEASSDTLVPTLEEILAAHPQGLSEHQLLKRLADHPALKVDSSGRLALFHRHFVLMNALYRLQAQMALQGCTLSISPLHIQCRSASTASPHEVAGLESTTLKDYYLDWTNFHGTGEDEVTRLLAGFWRNYEMRKGRAEALRILDLPREASGELVERRYRQLAARHHPDKGGKAEDFVRIREAYGILKS